MDLRISFDSFYILKFFYLTTEAHSYNSDYLKVTFENQFLILKRKIPSDIIINIVEICKTYFFI